MSEIMEKIASIELEVRWRARGIPAMRALSSRRLKKARENASQLTATHTPRPRSEWARGAPAAAHLVQHALVVPAGHIVCPFDRMSGSGLIGCWVQVDRMLGQ